MDKRIFLLLIVLVAFSVEAKKKILKKKLNQLKGKNLAIQSSSCLIFINWNNWDERVVIERFSHNCSQKTTLLNLVGRVLLTNCHFDQLFLQFLIRKDGPFLNSKRKKHLYQNMCVWMQTNNTMPIGHNTGRQIRKLINAFS